MSKDTTDPRCLPIPYLYRTLGDAMSGGHVTVLVPAHNEEQQIGPTLRALARQTVQPAQVMVVCDNCTDATAEVAQAHGAAVLNTEGNEHKKAGALNQALGRLLPSLGDNDIVLIQDADSSLDPDFIENAIKYVDQGYGAVGGVFRGGPGGQLVGHLQRNEYARYARDVARLRGKCLVVTGTAAAFGAGVLRSVSAARLAGRLPAGDGYGGVYDTSVLTEDNELTFALKHLGYRVIAASDCRLETEVMQTWGELWRQRLRWKRGAIENCVQYGWTKITRPYWGRQLVTALGILVTAIYLSALGIAVATTDVSITPFWLWVTALFIVERVVTVRYRGWRQMLLAVTMYELVLDYFLQACHAAAYTNALLRTTKSW